MHDLHVHSNYSDGAFLEPMVKAAEAAGQDALGFADHCYISEREALQDARSRTGMTLDCTYQRRRYGIDRLQEESNIRLYDAVEMDYDSRDREAIHAFLADAAFEYSIGSVHRIDDVNIQVRSNFEDTSATTCKQIVDEYYETLVEMIGTELFDIAAHIDLPERTPALQGYATEEHYRSVAEAFKSSKTVPEINVGRALTTEQIIHPSEMFLEVLLEYDLPFTVGSDAHEPHEIAERTAFLNKYVSAHGIKVLTPAELPR